MLQKVRINLKSMSVFDTANPSTSDVQVTKMQGDVGYIDDRRAKFQAAIGDVTLLENDPEPTEPAPAPEPAASGDGDEEAAGEGETDSGLA